MVKADCIVFARTSRVPGGLVAARERAARIGGKFTLGSSSNSGTEIKLIVPGGIIFRKMMPARRFLFTKIRTLFR
jgi:hypothetical protein